MVGAESVAANAVVISPRAISAANSSANTPSGPGPKGRDDFVEHHSAAAERVAQASGIPASFMLGQAGHETGWWNEHGLPAPWPEDFLDPNSGWREGASPTTPEPGQPPF